MLGTLAVTPGYSCTGMFTTHLQGRGALFTISPSGTQGCKVLLFTFPPRGYTDARSFCLQFISGDTRIQGPSVYISSPGTQGCKFLLFTFPPRGHKDTRCFCLRFPPGDTRMQGPSVYVSTPGTQTVLGTLAVTSGYRNVGVTLHIHATLVNFTVLCSALPLYYTWSSSTLH